MNYYKTLIYLIKMGKLKSEFNLFPICQVLHLFVGVDEVALQVLGHTETLDLLRPEDGSHGVIGSEPLLVLGILQVLLLEVGPETLGALKQRL